MAEQTEPTILVIFGITGDLARRYLLPALYHLCKDNLLGEHAVIVGTSRQALDVDEFLQRVELCVLETDNICDPEVLKTFRSKLQLVQLDPVNGQDYASLHQTLDAIEDQHGVCMNRLYYLSIPPQIYGPIVQHLGENGLNLSCQHGRAATRLLVEKPFGYDLTSAQDLISATAEHFNEGQVFRIDHYLAKELSRHILSFRQANPELEARWNNQHLRRIEIQAFESLGIEGRLFYDQVGALRDFIQSHLLQLLALVAVDVPSDTSSQALHAAKRQLLQSVQPVPPEQVNERVIRAQYEAYRAEVNNPHSATETFAAVTVYIPTNRWQGVPIQLATGKALKEKVARIVLHFDHEALELVIQPNPGIHGLPNLQTTIHDDTSPISHDQEDAYERVLIDAMRGDHSLFVTADEVLASWQIVQPVLNEWAKQTADLKFYPIGSDPQPILSLAD